jgi:hypothetical protein
VHRIEQVGLAHAVGTGEAVHLGPKGQIGLTVIAELEELELAEVHGRQR